MRTLRLPLALLAAALLAACEQTPTAPTAPNAARTTPPPAAVTGTDVAPYSAVAAPEWTALFDRTSGWTGADGIYSIPLSGDERPGTAGSTETFFTFSDTFIGQVDAGGARLPGWALVNNTNALMHGAAPDPAQIQFNWKTAASGAPAAMVVPTKSGRWYWPADGIVVNGTLRLFALRMKSALRAGFAVEGIDLLSDAATDRPLFRTYTAASTPFYVGKTATAGDMYFGLAILPNTAAAGAPNPDGWLYVYGVRNDRSKKLVVGRVQPNDIATFSKYTFWNGSAWVTGAAKAAPLTDRLSSEFSVTPLADGRYMLVFQLDALGKDVAVRYGSSPVGPWGNPISIWSAPEVAISPNVFPYNAKAHPHLSNPGELLISYNVNTFDNNENVANADIYHPRFIRLPLP